MAIDREARLQVATIRTLTKQEIDRRIQGLIDEVTGRNDETGDGGVHEAEGVRPRWISAAELVRRLRPFIVYN